MTEEEQLSENIKKAHVQEMPSVPVGRVTMAPRVYPWFTYWSQDSLSLTLTLRWCAGVAGDLRDSGLNHSFNI